MRRTAFNRWRITDPETGAQRITTYRMTREDALTRFPGAEASIECRDVPESPDEWQAPGRPKTRVRRNKRR